MLLFPSHDHGAGDFDIYQIIARYHANGANDITQAVSHVANDNYQLLIAEFDGTNLNLTLNNSNYTLATSSRNVGFGLPQHLYIPDNPGRTLNVGRYGHNGAYGIYWQGYISKIALWNRTLTTAEKGDIYDTGWGYDLPLLYPGNITVKAEQTFRYSNHSDNYSCSSSVWLGDVNWTYRVENPNDATSFFHSNNTNHTWSYTGFPVTIELLSVLMLRM